MSPLCSAIFSIYFAIHVCAINYGDLIGCYKFEGEHVNISNFTNIQECLKFCESSQNKYTVLSNSTSDSKCFCTNFLGEPSDANCNDDYVYYSEDKTLGPPKNLRLIAQNDENVVIRWDRPGNRFLNVSSYEINATVLRTFATFPHQNTMTWVYSGNTFQTALNLQPGSEYNLSISARSNELLGESASLIVETKIGTPDNAPSPPKIVARNGSKMFIRIYPATNNNGPITFYQIIVLSEAAKQIFQPEYLKNYQESLDEDLSYYITAETLPDVVNFTVGDAKYYGNYFNAPLIPSINYDIIVGIVSSYKNVTKTAYSMSSSNKIRNGVHILEHSEVEAPSSLLPVFLITCIVILSILVIVVILVFVVLRNRVSSNRHNRLSEQELTLQGPMISVENSAYLPDDEQASSRNHYQNLKKKVRILSLKDELSVDAHSIVARGKFGAVCSATLRGNDQFVPVAAYSIPDKSLDVQTKKNMLRDLDMLIKCDNHENLIELVGTAESSHMLYVILKVYPTNLKQFLLNNRVLLPTRFFRFEETQLLNIISQTVQGLCELENHRIFHSKLCARNILVAEDLTPKIYGFGLSEIDFENELDYTRWTGLEILKGGAMNSRSPVWSFGVLLWEICALGGTPYNDISTNQELGDRISKGLRLPQLKYFNDDLYQIMLSCWQVDMGERPDCQNLSKSIENLYEDTIIPFVSFKTYQNFEYEECIPKLEFKNSS